MPYPFVTPYIRQQRRSPYMPQGVSRFGAASPMDTINGRMWEGYQPGRYGQYAEGMGQIPYWGTDEATRHYVETGGQFMRNPARAQWEADRRAGLITGDGGRFIDRRTGQQVIPPQVYSGPQGVPSMSPNAEGLMQDYANAKVAMPTELSPGQQAAQARAKKQEQWLQDVMKYQGYGNPQIRTGQKPTAPYSFSAPSIPGYSGVYSTNIPRQSPAATPPYVPPIQADYDPGQPVGGVTGNLISGRSVAPTRGGVQKAERMENGKPIRRLPYYVPGLGKQRGRTTAEKVNNSMREIMSGNTLLAAASGGTAPSVAAGARNFGSAYSAVVPPVSREVGNVYQKQVVPIMNAVQEGAEDFSATLQQPEMQAGFSAAGKAAMGNPLTLQEAQSAYALTGIPEMVNTLFTRKSPRREEDERLLQSLPNVFRKAEIPRDLIAEIMWEASRRGIQLSLEQAQAVARDLVNKSRGRMADFGRR